MDYDASVRLNDFGTTRPATRDREVQSAIAVGLGFSPSAYISILGGISFGSSYDFDANSQKRTERNLLALTFGVGGNLDIFTLFTKP